MKEFVFYACYGSRRGWWLQDKGVVVNRCDADGGLTLSQKMCGVWSGNIRLLAQSVGYQPLGMRYFFEMLGNIVSFGDYFKEVSYYDILWERNNQRYFNCRKERLISITVRGMTQRMNEAFWLYGEIKVGVREEKIIRIEEITKDLDMLGE